MDKNSISGFEEVLFGYSLFLCFVLLVCLLACFLNTGVFGEG